MVVRNASLFRLYAPSVPAIEAAYQFLGTKIVFLDSRDLSVNLTGNSSATPSNCTTPSSCPGAYYDPLVAADRECGLFEKMWIDGTIKDRLSWLGMYVVDPTASRTSYDIASIDYGNVFKKYNIAKPFAPPYMNFSEPVAPDQWTYQGN